LASYLGSKQINKRSLRILTRLSRELYREVRNPLTRNSELYVSDLSDPECAGSSIAFFAADLRTMITKNSLPQYPASSGTQLVTFLRQNVARVVTSLTTA
jgi:hypothetical protein